jgi:ABC-type branched-subunit amino acid transport system ATPase component
MTEPILAAKGVTAGYGSVPIIHEVDLNAHRGEITVIVGLNGAGKSTLLKAIVGVIKPSSGRVELNGKQISGSPPEALIRQGLSYVPQVANVFAAMSVHENLEMGGFILRSGISERITEVCELFPDLRAALKRPARTLSGGQRHMLAVARGLMVHPTTLLLDEPTVGLAPVAEAALWDRIKAVRDTGVAIVVVDQNVRRALGNADAGYVMSMGRNLVSGRGEDLLHDSSVGNLYAKPIAAN